MNRNSRHFIDRAVDLALALREPVATLLASPSEAGDLPHVMRAIRVATDRELVEEDFVDQYAQSLACSAAVLAIGGPGFRENRVRDWILAHANPIWRGVLRESYALLYSPSTARFAIDASPLVETVDASVAEAVSEATTGGEHDWTFYLYETFLALFDSRLRARHGVFYTPQPIAHYIVSQVHRLLIDTFGLDDGLADATNWGEAVSRHPSLAIPKMARSDEAMVRILDPAAGTGVFLAEVIFLVHRTLSEKWLHAGNDAATCVRQWDEFVARHLLPRLFGLELMLPACVIATLKIVQALAETGFTFTLPSRLELHLANTLAGPMERQLSLFEACDESVEDAARDGRTILGSAPFTVIVGNPPFSGISRDTSRWIIDLLRGMEGGRRRWASYYEVDDQPLGERKTWLQDDYVKFMRFAHWKIETTGCGIVGLVTNHGYLDNPTFRGLRQQLQRTFPQISLVDLHGNRKKKELAPDGTTDENVFSIDQGTAIGLLCRPPGIDPPRSLQHAELWGPAVGKLDVLRAAASPSSLPAVIDFQHVQPQSPLHLFVPRDSSIGHEYAKGALLTEIMPRYVTAPVTARDRFVIAFTRDELLERMEEFRDLTIPDDDIRARYFTRTRSPKYAAGDTRGWKLHQARLRIAEDPDWWDHVCNCWYRPFDRRFVYWTDWMIDWPRTDMMQYLEPPGNLAIVARRQMLPTQPRNYFWITDSLALDGLIRSDNRGSEYLFPLQLGQSDSGDGAGRTANLADEFIIRAACRLGLEWLPNGNGDLQDTFGPPDLLHYLYGHFFSNTYRGRYASPLLSDFPRVFLPRDGELFAEICRCGRRLADAHLLRGEDRSAASPDPQQKWTVGQSPVVASGFPKHEREKAYINRDVWLDGVTPDAWAYHVGGHQVCRKWLKDRRGRALTEQEMATYAQIVQAIEETLLIAQRIDAAIELYGGWTKTMGMCAMKP